MKGSQQRSALQRQIWQIENDVRGAVDGWDFKQYVLGTLFYRFISENFASYMETGDDSINYVELKDSVITAELTDELAELNMRKKQHNYYRDIMLTFEDGEVEWLPLEKILAPKGYIRGPFGSSLKKAFFVAEGVPVYVQQHAIYDNRDLGIL